MKLYNQLVDKEVKLSLIGLGYVGMPIAVAFAKKINVIGFDLNEKKIEIQRKFTGLLAEANVDPSELNNSLTIHQI